MSKDELQKETTEETPDTEVEEAVSRVEDEEEELEVSTDDARDEAESDIEESEDESDSADEDADLDTEEDGEDEDTDDSDDEDDVITEKEGNENDIVEEDEEEEVAGEEDAEVSDEPKKNPLLMIIFGVLIITIIILLVQRLGGDSMSAGDQTASVLGEVTIYQNTVHGFSMEYPDTFQLIASDSIPDELAAQGISSMEMMGLSDGDALLVQEDSASDNIVYTILALSNQPLFTTTEQYVADLKANLESSGDEFNFEYSEKEVAVGEQKIDAFEFSFEMEVPGNDGESTRQGAFYDTIFEQGGVTYSVSFGYPKDVPDGEVYLDAYEALLSSIDFDVDTAEELEG